MQQLAMGWKPKGLHPSAFELCAINWPDMEGSKKGGSVDIVFDQRAKLQDPKDTIVERQLKAMHQLVQAWPQAQRGDLKTVMAHLLAPVEGCSFPLDGCCWAYGSSSSLPHGYGLGRRRSGRLPSCTHWDYATAPAEH